MLSENVGGGGHLLLEEEMDAEKRFLISESKFYTKITFSTVIVC
jgi:hypothetical protein